MSAFKPGDTVYTTDARECVYVARATDGHIVREVIEAGEPGELDMGQPEVHWQVSATPPKARYSAEAAKAKAELDTLQKQLVEGRKELKALQTERAAALKTLASHPQLEPVLEYIEGRLTHAAVFSTYGGGITIKSIQDAVKGDAEQERNGNFRLLALYGGKHGPSGPSRYAYNDSLSWRLNRYSDGSGNSDEFCILGSSEQVVRERLQRFLDANWENRGIWNEHTIEAWAASALKIGLNVPQRLIETVAQKEAQARARALEQAAKTLDDLRRRTQQAEQELANATAAVATASGEGA